MSSTKFLLVLMLLTYTAYTQNKLPVIQSTVSVISIRDGNKLLKNAWRLAPEANPDVYEAQLVYGEPHTVTFITDIDSISFMVEEGEKYDFIIRKGDDLCYTQIVGTRFIPAAVFDEKYQAAHRGKIFVEIPEVYELVNIALALTPSLAQQKYMVYKNSNYFKRVRQWFDKYSAHRLVAKLDSLLQKSLDYYNSLKNNAYAFEFDQNGKILQSKVYNRIGFERSNSLRPYLPLLQTFADESNFRKFYKENWQTYQRQIAFYRDTLNVAEMIHWLQRNFPASNGYDSYKIIFSPLVYGWQNVVWLESNGFKELQAHINFPYPRNIKDYDGRKIKITKRAENVFRGLTVFTEINHGYINPEADKYTDRIAEAVNNRNRWVDMNKDPNYYPGNATFIEYLNWGLFNLYIVDFVSRDEQDKLIPLIDQTMIKGRGFTRFDAFSKFLVDLYRNRKPEQTVADLYPEIIEWFEKNNK